MAPPGEILVGEDTLRLVRDAVEVEPLAPLTSNDRSAPLRASRLLSVDPIAPGLARHLDVPLVGRERELGLLRAAWDRTVEECGCHLFSLLGVAGVGKSRLVAELLTSIGDAAIALSGRCLHYGEGITFWPVIEALQAVGGPARGVLEQLGSGGAATPEELFWEVRRLLEQVALERPLIVHFDYLQWAEPMLLDLLDHIVELSRGVPILLLCTSRPELLEDRPAWGGGKLNATTVLLERLDAIDCEVLLDQLGDGLAPELRAQVIAASGGNPLFLEEISALARGRGIVAVPPTIQALLAARLERLPSDELELLERGSIEGEVFHRLAVRALCSERLTAELEPRVAGLVRKDLIRPHPPALQGDDAFRFRHLLLRDAAYDGLPKTTRADLHDRFATWLEETAGTLAELDEIAGWHLEQAVGCRRDLGRTVDPALARRAAEHLHAAGQRAGQRSDAAAARNLLDRAYTLTPDGSTLHARIGVDLAEQLLEGGDLARVGALLAAAEKDPATAALAALTRFEWLFFSGSSEGSGTLDTVLPEMLERLTQAGDDYGLARAHLAAFWGNILVARAKPAGEQALLAADHARSAHHEGLRSRALGLYIGSSLYGPQDAATIEQRLDTIESDASGPYVGAFISLGRGEVERLRGNLEDARRLIQQSIEEFEAMGIHTNVGGCQFHLAWTEMAGGQPARALPGLLKADAKLEQAGEGAFRSTLQAVLAQVYERLEDPDRARCAIASSEELSADEDLANVVMIAIVHARLALSDGDLDAAERWVRSAVQKAFRTDFVFLQGNAELELARVLQATGRREEATAHAGSALELYHAKGDQPGCAEAQAVLHALGVSG